MAINQEEKIMKDKVVVLLSLIICHFEEVIFWTLKIEGVSIKRPSTKVKANANWMRQSALLRFSRSIALWIVPRATVVEVGTPVTAVGALDVVTVGVLCKSRDRPYGAKAVV